MRSDRDSDLTSLCRDAITTTKRDRQAISRLAEFDRPASSMRPQLGRGRGQDRFGPESESRLHGFYEDDDDPAAPVPRGSSNRRQRVAAIAIVLVLVVLAIYGANIFEWVTAIMNPHQDPCNPVNVTLDDILGPSYPAQSLNDSRYWTGPQTGGVPHKRALSPPCTIRNAKGEIVPTFVQVTGVYLRNYSIALYDCSDHFKYVNGGGPYPNHQIFCDNVGDVLAMGTMNGQVHIEFDQDWEAKGLCGPDIPSCDTVTIADYRSNGTISLDFRGYVYWDEDHWEIHPATAWKPSTTAKWASASMESTPGPAESTYVLERPSGRVAVFREELIFVPNAVRISAARTTSDSATRSSGT